MNREAEKIEKQPGYVLNTKEAGGEITMAIDNQPGRCDREQKKEKTDTTEWPLPVTK